MTTTSKRYGLLPVLLTIVCAVSYLAPTPAALLPLNLHRVSGIGAPVLSFSCSLVASQICSRYPFLRSRFSSQRFSSSSSCRGSRLSFFHSGVSFVLLVCRCALRDFS